MRTISLLAVTLCSFVACSTSGTKVVESPAPTEGKVVAPVDVQAELSAKEAKLTLKLDEDASDLAVSVWGLDGLVVGAPSTFTPSLTKRGERQTVVVPMTPGPGRSNLAVSVSGTFNGQKKQRVATFAVGDGPLKQSGEVLVTDQGEVIKAHRAPDPKPAGTDRPTGNVP